MGYIFQSGKSSSSEIPKILKQKYPQIEMSEKEIAESAAKILKELFKKEAKLMPKALDAIIFLRKTGLKSLYVQEKIRKNLK